MWNSIHIPRIKLQIKKTQSDAQRNDKWNQGRIIFCGVYCAIASVEFPLVKLWRGYFCSLYFELLCVGLFHPCNCHSRSVPRQDETEISIHISLHLRGTSRTKDMLRIVKLSRCKKRGNYYSTLPLPRWYVKQLGAGSYLGLQITTQPLSDLLQFGPIQRMRRAGRAPISDIILKFQFTYHPWSAAIQLSEHPAMHNRENAAKIAAISCSAAKNQIEKSQYWPRWNFWSRHSVLEMFGRFYSQVSCYVSLSWFKINMD